MPDTGNGPQFTSPWYASDEIIAGYALGDFPILCPASQILAAGADGVFAPNAPWVLTSASVNFEQQGVEAQNIVWLRTPERQFPGGGHLLAVDSVAGNSVTLRRYGWPLGKGQAPSPAAGLTAVTFSVPTLGPQIDNATDRLKRRFAISEDIFYRSSAWVYQGVEDPYRVFRDAVVFEVLVDCYMAQTRDQVENGDFARKIKLYRNRLDEALAQITVKWGIMGASQDPPIISSCRLAR